MKLDAFLATIIIVTFLVTILMAIASYGAYKLRERRKPVVLKQSESGESLYFERVAVADFDSSWRSRGRRA